MLFRKVAADDPCSLRSTTGTTSSPEAWKPTGLRLCRLTCQSGILVSDKTVLIYFSSYLISNLTWCGAHQSITYGSRLKIIESNMSNKHESLTKVVVVTIENIYLS